MSQINDNEILVEFSNYDENLIKFYREYINIDKLNELLIRNTLKLNINSDLLKNLFIINDKILYYQYKELSLAFEFFINNNFTVDNFKNKELINYYNNMKNNLLFKSLQFNIDEINYSFSGIIEENDHCICNNNYYRSRVELGYYKHTTIDNWIDNHTDECTKFRLDIIKQLQYNKIQFILFKSIYENILRELYKCIQFAFILPSDNDITTIINSLTTMQGDEQHICRKRKYTKNF